MADFRTYNSPGGPAVFGVQYLLDQSSGVFRPVYSTDFLGASGTTVNVSITGVSSVTGSIATTPAVPNATSARAAYTVQSTFTRPNDNTAYAVGDVVSNSTTTTPFNVISGAAFVSGRGGIIQNMVLAKTGTNVTSAAFNVHFYTYSGATIPGYDNFPMTGLYANSPYSLGYVSFPTMTAAVGAGSIGRAFYQQAAFEYTTTDTPHLYWILEANGAYTPAAGEGFSLLVTMLRD